MINYASIKVGLDMYLSSLLMCYTSDSLEMFDFLYHL